MPCGDNWLNLHVEFFNISGVELCYGLEFCGVACYELSQPWNIVLKGYDAAATGTILTSVGVDVFGDHERLYTGMGLLIGDLGKNLALSTRLGGILGALPSSLYLSAAVDVLHT